MGIKTRLNKSKAILRLKEFRKIQASSNFRISEHLMHASSQDVSDKNHEIEKILEIQIGQLNKESFLNPVLMEANKHYLESQHVALKSFLEVAQTREADLNEKRSILISCNTREKLFKELVKKQKIEQIKSIIKNETIHNEKKHSDLSSLK